MTPLSDTQLLKLTSEQSEQLTSEQLARRQSLIEQKQRAAQVKYKQAGSEDPTDDL